MLQLDINLISLSSSCHWHFFIRSLLFFYFFFLFVRVYTIFILFVSTTITRSTQFSTERCGRNTGRLNELFHLYTQYRTYGSLMLKAYLGGEWLILQALTLIESEKGRLTHWWCFRFSELSGKWVTWYVFELWKVVKVRFR